MTSRSERTSVPTTSNASSTAELETVTFYVRARWTEASLPTAAFNPTAGVPPVSLTNVELDSRIFERGKSGNGPFERVLIRIGDR